VWEGRAGLRASRRGAPQHLVLAPHRLPLCALQRPLQLRGPLLHPHSHASADRTMVAAAAAAAAAPPGHLLVGGEPQHVRVRVALRERQPVRVREPDRRPLLHQPASRRSPAPPHAVSAPAPPPTTHPPRACLRPPTPCALCVYAPLTGASRRRSRSSARPCSSCRTACASASPPSPARTCTASIPRSVRTGTCAPAPRIADRRAPMAVPVAQEVAGGTGAENRVWRGVALDVVGSVDVLERCQAHLPLRRRAVRRYGVRGGAGLGRPRGSGKLGRGGAPAAMSVRS
jgi:hypothetical protein